MIILFLTMFVPLFLIDFFIPYVIRKTTVFGISIPEPFIDDEQLTQFKKKYSFLLACFQIPFLIFLFVLSSFLTETLQSIMLTTGLFIYLFISLGIYITLHKQTEAYKRNQGWDEQVSIVRVSKFETKFDKQQRTFPHIFFIPTFLITIGLMIWLMYIYPSLPSSIPTHWGVNGQPDAWSDKSFFTVSFIIFTLLFIQILNYALAYGIFNSAVQIKANHSELSLKREVEIRKLNNEMMAILNLGCTLFFAVLLVQSNVNILNADSTLSLVYSLPVFLLLTFGAIYYYMKRSRELNKIFKEVNDTESSPGDDAYWKWGIFYFNKDNPDVFIEKKFGVGWTINFARPGAWIFIFTVGVVPLLPLFFI